MKFNAILILYLILSFSYISCRGEDKNQKNDSGAVIVTAVAAIATSTSGTILAFGIAAYLVGHTLGCGISAYQCHQKEKCTMKYDTFGCSFE